MKKNNILLIFPKLGSEDIFLKDPPLSLLYAAAESVKRGYTVNILDLRLYANWKEIVEEKLLLKPSLVGISVYTGNPIKISLDISAFVKEKDSNIKIVWGGPHVTMAPELTLKEKNIDYLIRGFGSLALAELSEYVFNDKGNLNAILGLSYKQNNEDIHNEINHEIENIDFKDIPYDLIKNDIKKYGRLSQNEILMPLFTSMGCPYQCSFCISPIVYKHTKVKWVGFKVEEIINHIKILKEKYGVNHISVYDDDAFVDLNRMKLLLHKIVNEDFNIKFSFRGARINELDNADDELLKLICQAGTSYIQVGVESGSDRILRLIKKGITVQQILRVNKKLSKYNVIPMYNIMTGIPTETIADLKMTADIMVTLRKENKNCFVGFPVKYKPQPGSELFNLSAEHGLITPSTLEEWVKFDSGDSNLYLPWYTKKYNHFINMMQVCSYFFDNKILVEIKGTTLFNKILRVLYYLYHPIAYFRIKYKCDKILIEHYMLKLFRFISRTFF